MRVLVTGGSGFVGRRLCERLMASGHEVLVISRDPDRARERLPAGVCLETAILNAIEWRPEAIVNLAGEPIADKRWSESQKQRLIESRVNITRDLVMLCRHMPTPPSVMVSGSAMGYYGDQGSREVSERTPPHDEFAHRLCERWENAAREVEECGVRLVILRIGLVLGPNGGTLSRLLLPFKLGLGGRLGNGRQFMPWIHREDLVSAIEFLLVNEGLAGPFNGSAPHPVTNAEFTKLLAKRLNRPAVLAVPAPLLKLGLGEMSRLLLTGADMRPARLQAAGFDFRFPTADTALADILG
ncbi:TIGR01777 family oxidoreductase [Aidingimonas lacisalsi]|uniref:TIGR01777 family oxidoreductase n=1 Tax=Aidingimonas lacisalsi TaxID=2604086 RepID=UPI0011D18FDB|nr:TIGR01777 family oxidoreductase [Aidingimonas lacisalsi]